MKEFLINAIGEAKSYLQTKQFEKAVLTLQPFVIENNRDYRIYNLLGLIYHKNGNFNKAINNYRKAIELNSNDVESFLNLSLIHNDLGKYEEGSNFYNKAFEVFKNIETRVYNENLSDIDEMFSKQHKSIGELYLRYNKLEEAEYEFKKAIKLDETNLDSYLLLSEVLYRLKKKNDAFKLLNYIKNKNFDISKISVKLGHLYYLEGNHSQALIEWDSVLEKDENNSEAKMYKKLIEY